MKIEKRPYELLTRFQPDGAIANSALREVRAEYNNGKWVRDLSGTQSIIDVDPARVGGLVGEKGAMALEISDLREKLEAKEHEIAGLQNEIAGLKSRLAGGNAA